MRLRRKKKKEDLASMVTMTTAEIWDTRDFRPFSAVQQFPFTRSEEKIRHFFRIKDNTSTQRFRPLVSARSLRSFSQKRKKGEKRKVRITAQRCVMT